MSTTGLNVLIVARYADRRGGADVYSEALATHLAKQNDVSLLCHSASDKVHRACNVFEIVEPSYRDIKVFWRIAPILYQRHWRNAINSLNAITPDVIISSMPLSSNDLRNRFSETPLVYLPHSRIAPVEATDIETNSRVQWKIARRLYSQCEKWSLINATTVRFTKGNERELRSYYDLSSDATFQIISAPVEWVSDEERLEVGNPLRFVSVGRLVESKNLLWLVGQMSKLRTFDWEWTIVGDGPQRSELQSAVANAGLEDQVTFRGFCEDISDVYRAADLQLFPSKRESLGLVILEAMAFGVPTLAFDPNGAGIQTASDEVIVQGVDGFLAKNEVQYSRLIHDIIEQPQELLKIGEAGRRKVLNHHTWATVSASWQKLLNRLVRRSDVSEVKEPIHV